MAAKRNKLTKRVVLNLLKTYHNNWLDKLRYPKSDAQYQLANGRIGAYDIAIRLVKQL